MVSEILRDRKLLKFSIGIFLVATATLIYEVALSYEYAFMFWFNTSFAAIAIAMLGLGVGSVIGYFLFTREAARYSALMKCSTAAFGGSMLVSLFLIAEGSKRTILMGDIYAMIYFPLVSAIPFMFSGICLSVGLNYPSPDRRVISFIYFSDLVGAGIGSFALSFLLPYSSLEVILVAVSVITVASSMFFLLQPNNGEVLKTLGVAALIGMIVFQIDISHILAPQARGDKLLSVLKDDGGKVLTIKWTAVSRVDVVDGFDGEPVRFIVNGQFPVSAFLAKEFLNWVERDPRFIGFTRKPNSVLVIGSGGGIELAMANYVNASRIVGVEIVPFIVQYTMNDLEEYTGGIYQADGIETVIEDGRTYTARANEEFDLIENGVIGNNGLVVPSSNLLNFQDAYVYTVEANIDYWRHLSPNGVAVTIIHSRLDDYNVIDLEKGVTYYLLRQYFTVKEALSKEGADAKKHLMMFRLVQTTPKVGSVGVQAEYTLVFKEELTPERASAMIKVAEGLNMEVLYSPYYPDSVDFKGIAQMIPMDRSVSPVRDDRPYFYHTEKSPPPILLLMLISLALLTVVFIILPIVVVRRAKFESRATLPMLGYFLCLGVGYILIEVVVIQKFTLFLGKPAYAFQVVLFSMLVFSGVGSFITTFFKKRSPHALALKVLAGVTLSALLYVYLLPSAIYAFIPHTVLEKVFITIGMLAPLAVLMGMPFPLGLRIVGELSEKDVIWMYGLNGVGSVVGGVIGMIIAFGKGFTYSLAFGVVVYFTAFLIMLYVGRIVME